MDPFENNEVSLLSYKNTILSINLILIHPLTNYSH